MTTPQRSTFGLAATDGPSRVFLPLKAVKCAFTVVAGLAEVSITQVFRQENDRPLDCQYLFPLPAGAAVFRCEAQIEERVIEARVEERQKARELAALKKREGHRTVLVEAERANLFTLSLGNLQPGDWVEVRFTYFQPVRRTAQENALEIPFCPGVRYIPGRPLLRSNRGKGIKDDTDEVPDASRISPVRIDGAHPDAAFISVEGRVESRFLLAESLRSPSHRLVATPDDGWMCVTLEDKSAVPDSDFMLRWEEIVAPTVSSRAWTCKEGPHTYALMEIRAPAPVPDLQTVPQDVYFLIDRSGSMEGAKWVKAVEALQAAIRTLGAQDRAMVTFFSHEVRDFAEKPLPTRTILADSEFGRLAEIGTLGGTEMVPALRHVLGLVRLHSDGRRTNLVLVTDAQVGNDRNVLKALTEFRGAPELRVHCFGIDTALNDALLEAVARQQGGTYQSLHPHEDIASAVANLARSLGQPTLLSPRLEGAWELSGRLPDLYAGQVFFASARIVGEPQLLIAGTDALGRSRGISFEVIGAPDRTPFLHWSRTRIQGLLDADPSSLEAVKLAKEANLVCELTAFVAWDQTEKVAVGTDELVQPDMTLEELLEAHPLEGTPVKRLKLCLALESNGEDPLQCLMDSSGKTGIQVCRYYGTSVIKEELFGACQTILDAELRRACERLAVWVFESPEPLDWGNRHQEVEELLPRLETLSKEISLARQELAQLVPEFRALLASLVEDLDGCLKSAQSGSATTAPLTKTARIAELGRCLDELLQRVAVREQELWELLRPPAQHVQPAYAQ